MPRILIVDDDVIISMRLEELLGSMGYDVVDVASSGKEGVEMAKKLNPDLILMDIVMPGEMDGIDAAEKIREDLDIPVIFVTGHAKERFIERAKLVEPFGYILKPFQESQIKAAIDIALYKKGMDRRLQETHRELERKVEQLKLTEKELKASQLWLNSIFNSLDEAVFVLTPDRRLVNINKAAEKMFGITKEELENSSTEILHVDHDHFVKLGKKIQEAFDSGKTANFEFQSRRKNGEIFPTDHTVTVLRGDDGEPSGIVSVVRDITDRKLAEEALRESEEKYRSIFDNIQDVYFEINPDGHILEISPSVENFSKYKREELIGKSLNELYTNPEERNSIIRDILAKGKVYDLEVNLIDKDGYQHSCSTIATSVKDEHGNPIKFVGSLRDITDRKKAEKTLENAHGELEKKIEERTAELVKTNEELEVKTRELKEINSALNVLLKKRETDKQEVEEKVISNVKELIEPYLEKLMNTNLSGDQRTYLNILQTNLSDIVSPFLRNLAMNFSGLTPKEIQVASLVKEGKSTKEIVRLLNTTKRAVEFHRHSLRTKLGLKNKKANLRSHLLSLP